MNLDITLQEYLGTAPEGPQGRLGEAPKGPEGGREGGLRERGGTRRR